MTMVAAAEVPPGQVSATDPCFRAQPRAVIASGRSLLLAPLIILPAGVVACGVLLHILAPDHDNAFQLEIAGRMLAGGRYFHDLWSSILRSTRLMFPVHGLRA